MRRRYWENSFIILTWISPSGVDFLDWLSQLWDILRSKRKDINITPLNLLVCVAYPCLMTGNHLCLILFIRVINFINQNNLCPVLVIPGHSLELRVPFTVFCPLDVIILLLYCFFFAFNIFPFKGDSISDICLTFYFYYTLVSFCDQAFSVTHCTKVHRHWIPWWFSLAGIYSGPYSSVTLCV